MSNPAKKLSVTRRSSSEVRGARRSRATVASLNPEFHEKGSNIPKAHKRRNATEALRESDLLELQRSADLLYLKWKVKIQAFIELRQVEDFIIFLVIAYAVLVIVQIAFEEELRSSSTSRLAVNWADMCILVFFQVEIILKTIVFGWAYIWDKYQFFDAVLISISIGMGIMDFVVVDNDLIHEILSFRGILRIMRILIIFRRVSESQSSLSRIHRSNLGYDISSPVERVIMIMDKMTQSYHIPRQYRWKLQESIKIVRQGKLYEPIMGSQDTTDMNDEARAWLLKATQDNSAPISSNDKEGILEVRRINVENVNMRTHFPETEDILNKVNEWCIDIWKLQRLTSDNALVVLLRRLILRSGLFEAYIDMDCWDTFAFTLQAGYRSTNEYHNAVHAGDVTHSCFWILNATEFVKVAHLTPLEQLSLLLASACHDVDHRGTSNVFMIRTKDAVAIRYNDKNVLENHHVAVSFRIMQQPKHNIFRQLTTNQYDEIRALMTQNILATDISFHFEHLGKLSARMSGGEFPETRDDKVLLLGIALHCGDISNPTKPIDTYLMWTKRILTEYFLQGDRERELGFYPISMFTDRHTTNVAKCQIGFIDVLVHPLFRAAGGLLSDIDKTCMPILLENKSFWETRIEEMQQHMGEDEVYIPAYEKEEET